MRQITLDWEEGLDSGWLAGWVGGLAGRLAGGLARLGPGSAGSWLLVAGSQVPVGSQLEHSAVHHID